MTSILFLIARICCSRFKGSFLKNEKTFLNFLFHFSNLNPILNLSKKKMIVIALAFPKLQTVKDLVRTLSKNLRLRTLIEIQHMKESQTPVKSVWEHFYQILSTLWRKMTSNLFAIVRICCSWFKWNYLKNKKDFLSFLFNFSNLHPIWNILKEKMIVIALVFPKLQTGKDLVRPLSKEHSLRALLSYNFITLGESNFKNISFSDVWILKTKSFISIFVFPFLESTSNFKHF